MNTDSQCNAILEHLRSGGTVSNLAASIMFGCERLGARIYELRQRGNDIHTRMIKTLTGKRIAVYYMDPA